jgi:hypothetical protein
MNIADMKNIQRLRDGSRSIRTGAGNLSGQPVSVVRITEFTDKGKFIFFGFVKGN